MIIKELVLENFRGFDKVHLNMKEKNVVLAGTNGAGKSSILYAAAILLSYIAGTIARSGVRGVVFDEMDIKNDRDTASVRGNIMIDGLERELKIIKKRSANNEQQAEPEIKDDLKTVIEHWQKSMEENESFNVPVFVYYPVNRYVIDVQLEMKNSHGMNRLAVYEDSFQKGVNFSSFFKWYKVREDMEAEARKNSSHEYEDRYLRAVRKAIYTFMPEFSDLRTVRNRQRKMVVTKQNETLDMNQLSDGEKCTMAMIGDLARRLALANPGLDNPLEGKGIVLIDEIELHLHPVMEREIVNRLEETFPNIQFIMSTHSPQVLGEIRSAEIFFVSQHSGADVCVRKAPVLFGKDSNLILEQFMGAAEKNPEIKTLQRRLFKLLMDSRLMEAKILMDELVEILGSEDPAMIKADLILRRKESLKK